MNKVRELTFNLTPIAPALYQLKRDIKATLDAGGCVEATGSQSGYTAVTVQPVDGSSPHIAVTYTGPEGGNPAQPCMVYWALLGAAGFHCSRLDLTRICVFLDPAL